MLILLILPLAYGCDTGVTPEAELEQPEDHYSIQDLNHYAHGIYIASAISRDSEMGHENYRPELLDEPMRERAEQWLDLVSWIESNLTDMQGRIFDRYYIEDSRADESFKLSNYPSSVYHYHMHHRGDRYEHHGNLDERLFREPARFISMMGIHLLDNHFDEGRFYHDDSHTEFDHTSMSYALDGIHGHIYAWIRWDKPGGADDMGALTEDYLTTWLRYAPDMLTHYSRQIAEVLDDHWDDEAGIYDFGSGTTYRLDELAALLRGKKAVYEMLYVFGGDHDRESAETMFNRGTEILDALLEISQPWGLPAEIRFEGDQAAPAAEVVDLTQMYTFLNAIYGGFSYEREREGTSEFLHNKRPDLAEALGELSDELLLHSITEWQQNEMLVSAIDFETGEISDERHMVGPIGMFITAAGNSYRSGSAFERASDWDEVSEEVRRQSEQLYDAIIRHTEFLEDNYRLPETD